MNWRAVALNTVVATVVAGIVSVLFFSDRNALLQAVAVGVGVGLGTLLGQWIRRSATGTRPGGR